MKKFEHFSVVIILVMGSLFGALWVFLFYFEGSRTLAADQNMAVTMSGTVRYFSDDQNHRRAMIFLVFFLLYFFGFLVNFMMKLDRESRNLQKGKGK